MYQIRGIEAKATYSDFKNGFCMMPEYSYVIAPIGVVPAKELPQKVGLLEFDLEGYSLKNEIDKWENYLSVTKKPRKKYDPMFMDESNPKKFRFDKHAAYCRELVFDIAQENSEELIFWNPHIRSTDQKYKDSMWDHAFLYKIGEKVRKDIVVDRNLKYDKSHYRPKQFYKFAREGVGITEWIEVNPQIEKRFLLNR